MLFGAPTTIPCGLSDLWTYCGDEWRMIVFTHRKSAEHSHKSAAKMKSQIGEIEGETYPFRLHFDKSTSFVAG